MKKITVILLTYLAASQVQAQEPECKIGTQKAVEIVNKLCGGQFQAKSGHYIYTGYSPGNHGVWGTYFVGVESSSDNYCVRTASVNCDTGQVPENKDYDSCSWSCMSGGNGGDT